MAIRQRYRILEITMTEHGFDEDDEMQHFHMTTRNMCLESRPAVDVDIFRQHQQAYLGGEYRGELRHDMKHIDAQRGGLQIEGRTGAKIGRLINGMETSFV